MRKGRKKVSDDDSDDEGSQEFKGEKKTKETDE